MSQWGSAKARKVFKALLAIGWQVKREGPGSHTILQREGWDDYTFPSIRAKRLARGCLREFQRRPACGLRTSDPQIVC